jgi:predicted alpha/beta-fold hydrolase
MRIYLNMPQHAHEVIVLDIAIPVVSGHSAYKPVYFILYGFNGGSSEEYVRDFMWRRLSANDLVIVMIARELMNLPIRGWNVFHVDRWKHSYISLLHIKNAMKH